MTRVGPQGSPRVDKASIIASVDRRLVRLRVYGSSSRPVVKLQSLLAAVAIVTGVLFVLVGAVGLWRHGGGSGSLGVDVLWWIMWIVYTVAKLILIGVLVATIYQWVRSRQGASARS